MFFRIISPILLVLFLCSSAFGQEPLTAHIQKSWSIDDARIEAFHNAALQIDTASIAPIDPKLLENRQLLLDGRFKTNDRLLSFFPNAPMYSVSYICEKETVYYHPTGKVLMIQHASTPTYSNDSCPTSHPNKAYKYIYGDLLQGRGILNGQLYEVTLRVNGTESFIFKNDGQLVSHWLNSQCYSADGSSCGTRFSQED